MVSTTECTAPSASREVDASPTLHVRSRRFGSFEVATASIVDIPQGLVGFPQLRRYVVLEHRPRSPFKWLLAVDDPELAFAVANPCELVAGYEPPLELAARILDTDPREIALLVIVTIPSDPTLMTVNLMAPVVVDVRTRRARQIVLDLPQCPPNYLVVRPRVAARA
jgi:flagellar assembly factor FliW